MRRELFKTSKRSKGLHCQLINEILSESYYSKNTSTNKAIILLEKYGAEIDVNAFSESGSTALDIAVFYRQLDTIKKLLSLGANPDIGDKMFSVPPLITGIGIKETSLKVCTMLIDAGANVNYRDWCGQSPLWVASAYENIEILELLLNKGGHVNAIDHTTVTPLMRSAEYGRYENVKILLKYGANSSIKDEEGNTALDYAKKNAHDAVIELFQDIETG
jgi:ankyrin repeat protein